MTARRVRSQVAENQRERGTNSRSKRRRIRSKSACNSCTRSPSSGGSRRARNSGRASTRRVRTPSRHGSSTARRTHEALVGFLDRATSVEVPDPASGHEGMIEFDRRRALKGHVLELGVSACVEMGRAARTLAAILTPGPELPEAKPGREVQDESEIGSTATPRWEPLLVRIERAIVRGDVNAVRTVLPGFVSLFRSRAAPVLPTVRWREAARGAARKPRCTFWKTSSRDCRDSGSCARRSN